MGRGSVGYEMCWRTFRIASNKFFRSKSDKGMVLGGLAIEVDTTGTEVVVSGGAGNDDSDVYKYSAALLSTTGLATKTPYIPDPGISFPNGMLVDIGSAVAVSVLYKGDLE